MPRNGFTARAGGVVLLALCLLGLAAPLFAPADPMATRLEERLRNLGLVTGNREPSLTVAGALTLLETPSEHLGKAHVEVLRYPDEGVDYDRRVSIQAWRAVATSLARTAASILSALATMLATSAAPSCL